MKKLKSAREIKAGDYIKAYNDEGNFILFKALGILNFWGECQILDTNIPNLSSMINKVEIISRQSLKREFRIFRLNKFEKWLYII